MQLFLRLFADCESQRAASGLAANLAFALSAFSAEQAAAPRRYWKLPQQFEFTYRLAPPTESTFKEVVARSSSGWSHELSGSERSSVWNRAADLSFLVPQVSWAHVELHETSA